MENETYFIIFPGGDKSKLSVTSLNTYMYYEKSEYAVASRHEWKNEDEANKYCKELAKTNSLEYVGNDEGFLD